MICHELALYKCPGCFAETCCLKCSKTHKEEQSCKGKAKVAEFKSVKDMKMADLIRDASLLSLIDLRLVRSNRAKIEAMVPEKIKTREKRNKGTFIKKYTKKKFRGYRCRKRN